MEEKEVKISSSFRAIFNIRSFYSFISSRPNNSPDINFNIAQKKQGFTLVEILVVIGVLGVLITSLVVLINPIAQIQKSRDSRRITDLKQIQTALELYRSDCGSYPNSPPNTLPSPFTSDCTGTTFTYLQNVPMDPKGDHYYYQTIGSNGYEVSICSETAKAAGEGIKTHSVCGFVFFVNNP